MGKKEKKKVEVVSDSLQSITEITKPGTSLAVAGHVYDEMKALTRSFESRRICLETWSSYGDTCD